MSFHWFPLHRWQRGKHGSDLNLDCRRCVWCGRFEVYVWGYWVHRRIAEFPDAIFGGAGR